MKKGKICKIVGKISDNIVDKYHLYEYRNKKIILVAHSGLNNSYSYNKQRLIPLGSRDICSMASQVIE